MQLLQLLERPKSDVMKNWVSGLLRTDWGDGRLVLVESVYVTSLALDEWWIGRRKEHR